MARNADLIVYLIEQGITLQNAKAVDEQNPTTVPELVLALIEYAEVALGDARIFAVGAPLSPVAKAVRQPQQEPLIGDFKTAEDGAVNPRNPANVQRVAVVGPDGLTDIQRSALQANIPLCANCQQPVNFHLPGCARASGEDPKARTKSPLPPAV